MSPLIRTTSGSIELNRPTTPRANPRPDADGVTRLRKGESIALRTL